VSATISGYNLLFRTPTENFAAGEEPITLVGAALDDLEHREAIAEWERDDKTPIEMASIKDLAYLKQDVDELRRGLRTVWVLCIVSLSCLVISLGFLAARPAGVSKDDLKDVLKESRQEKVDKLLKMLEQQNGE
jgi:hypothetical protein